MSASAARHDDPYHLDPAAVQEAPTGWGASLKHLGPGLILSASIVGSGELIATTTLGAKAGFALLWMVIFSTFVKVAVQVELARWTISTGQPALTGYNKLGPHVAGVGWINLLWALMALSKLLQMGGVIGGVAIACSILLPLGGPPMETTSITVWTVIVAVGSIALLWSNSYSLIEKGATALVVVFSLVTIAIALGLPFTPYAYGMDDIATGLAFTIPAGAIGAAIAMFGITGVGADELTFYTYWCVEKGYAFFLMGAAVLNPQGLVPQGNEMITALSRMYTDTLGDWAGILFLLGAIAVLGSTLWAAVPSWSRMYVNLFAVMGMLDWHDPAQRLRWIRGFTIGLPLVWGLAYLFVRSPVLMIQIGGAATGVFLLAAVVAVWHLRQTETDPAIRGGSAFNALLAVSSVAIVLLGA